MGWHVYEDGGAGLRLVLAAVGAAAAASPPAAITSAQQVRAAVTVITSPLYVG